MSEMDVTADDALAVAQRALSKANELEKRDVEQQETIDELVEELTEVKLRLSEIDEERDYATLTLDEKIGMVREHGYRKAREGTGRAKLDYEDIMWEVFDGKPGTKHCYKLMRLAAGERDDDEELVDDESIPGFSTRDPADGNKHLAIDADRAERGAAFFPRTKTAEGEVR